MSGGHFSYHQYHIADIADEIEKIIKNNHKKDEYGYSKNFSKKIINEFKKGVVLLRQAEIYAHEIDWLVCDDTGEDSFMENLKEKLEKLKCM